ncbi:PREDICTED: UDP-GlcNAc:betaGal beta-1,3-N-acetylglucosaminyltransferase 9 [Tinamus guttatus]|uniref:UDP-GlcNAc:betaGal beta-1,3-N-acetylglucosaminyltransferase 9 n=1 Tax=Tinamus guttatus TaxID=94827 RepID=UPI00052E7FAB|nr:PREDICTED: UDP-GlcNAc:betaGal beta-1,3-N-acetylglucosaminyltransferase 9 [Tinamus guttatus]XP_010220335.1 PREDICTED: UDP-GlcNAc:betaGal beta-1,3-N-acetylglucosaminyltransferase 9 [Tinamus guttatus]
MKVHLKGDAICTLLLVVALGSLLYSQLQHLAPAGNKELTPKKPSGTQRVFSDLKAPGRLVPVETTVPVPQIIPMVRRAELASSRVQTTTSPPLTHSSFNFKRYLLNKDNRNFNILINQPKKCRKIPGGPFLLIAIKSVVEDFDRREIVRKTWAREGLVNGEQIQRVFLLGTPKNRTVLATWETLIHQESQAYKDILLWDFMDTFFNLTLKEIHFLNWAAEFCSNVKFIFKGDADVFVNVENIVDFLERHDPTEDLFVGDIIYNARPIRVRKSKYYIPETMYGLSIYPAYAGGGGFLLSSHTMRKLSTACKEVELFPIDDVFLGMCLQRINLKPILHEGFKTFGILKPSAAPHLQTFDPCFYKDLMVVHSLKVAEIWLMWNLLHSPRLSCTQKKQVRKPFQWKKKAQTATRASAL